MTFEQFKGIDKHDVYNITITLIPYNFRKQFANLVLHGKPEEMLAGYRQAYCILKKRRNNII